MARKRFLGFLLATAVLISTIFSGIPQINAEDVSKPDFDIFKSIDRTSYIEGETGKLTYTLMPKGTSPDQNKNAADIVMILDISTSMEDGNKIVKAVDAAAEFFERLKGTGYKATLVTFGYKVDFQKPLSEGYPDLIKQVNKYKEKDWSWLYGYYYKNLMSGTNYDDALKKAKEILDKGKAENKYAVFITDGMPNYFTSKSRVDKYDKNQFSYYENGEYYYTNHPKSTSEAYSYSLNDVKEIAESGIEFFTVGVGKGNEVDMGFLEEMAQAGSGKLYKAIDPDSMSRIFDEVSSEISDISISNIRIKEKLPEGISLVESSNAYLDEEGYVVVNVPPITFGKNAAMAPEPFAVDIEIVMNRKGYYDLNDSKVQYKGWNGATSEKAVNNVSFGVTEAEGAPSLKVSKVMLNSSAVVGENINLEYKIIPEGVFSSQASGKEAVDMVILFDKSDNMKKNYGSGNNKKHVLEKDTAKDLVNVVKSMNNGSRIGYVEYSRYASTVKPLTGDYQSVIESINNTVIDSIPQHESGVNYEAALSSAKEMLEGSTNQKLIILLTGSKPDCYTPPGAGSDTSRLPYTEAEAVVRGMDDTILHVMAIGKYHENSSGSDDHYDLNYLRSLSALAGGNTYEYSGRSQLYDELKTTEAAASEYRMKELVITEVFPSGIEILESDNIVIDSNNPSKFIASIPDVVFTDGEGTPSPEVLTIKVRFSGAGDYTLSNTSKLDYKDNDGTRKTQDFNKLEIQVSSPNYRIEKLTASKSYEDTVFRGIMADWNGNLLISTGDISKFVVMRSINGSDYEEIYRTDKTIFEFLDTDTTVNGRYLYRVDTLLKNGETVVGIPSNEVLLLGKGTTNVSTISQAIQINGQTITKAYESYKLNYSIDLDISDGSEGKTSGGIVNPEFTVRLNSTDNSDILYTVKDGSVKITDSNNNQVSGELTFDISDNGTANANLIISYNGVLAPGKYKIIFDAVPRKATEIKLPKQGLEVIMQLDIRWKDYGIETENSKQLEYRLWIMPLPKLM